MKNACPSDELGLLEIESILMRPMYLTRYLIQVESIGPVAYYPKVVGSDHMWPFFNLERQDKKLNIYSVVNFFLFAFNTLLK